MTFTPWSFLPFGYILTILIEMPIVYIGLSSFLSRKQRLFLGAWLTAGTYPIVILCLPSLLEAYPRWIYLSIAETFAPITECLMFYLAYKNQTHNINIPWRYAFFIISLANIASFALGELCWHFKWLDGLIK